MKKKNTLVLVAATLLLVGCNFSNPSVNPQSIPTTITTTIDPSTGSTVTVTVPTSQTSIPGTSTNPSVPSSSTTPTSLPSIPVDSKWNVDFSKYGKEFKEQLGSLALNKKTQTCSYSACLDIGAAATTVSGDQFVPFYHDKSTTTTTGACNREHTWPDSRGTGKTGPGQDPFIIRPTISSENNSRSNYFYGLGGKGNKEWDPASCGFEAARGEAARVIFYCATAYYSKGFELSNNPSDDKTLKTMGTLKYLVQWNKQYPVTEVEKQFNDYMTQHGYGRNPFVDHPEYADYIWNESGYVTSNQSGGNSGSYVPDEDTGTKYNLVDALNDINNASLAIVTAADSAGPYFGLTDSTKSADLPWYIVGNTVTTSSDKSTMSASNPIANYTFNKVGDKYTIKTGDLYLCNYTETKTVNSTEKTFYSIALKSDPGTYSNLWTITQNGSGFTLYGSQGVYLEYYNGSYCGYKGAPSVPIYLYKLA